jgi:hypothetical protein
MTTMEDDDSASLPSQLSDAVITTVRGGIRILGGIVQMAAGVTKLLAVTAIKAVEAAEEAVEATIEDDEESEPKAKLDPL